jgi:hypothetical protein
MTLVGSIRKVKKVDVSYMITSSWGFPHPISGFLTASQSFARLCGEFVLRVILELFRG